MNVFLLVLGLAFAALTIMGMRGKLDGRLGVLSPEAVFSFSAITASWCLGRGITNLTGFSDEDTLAIYFFVSFLMILIFQIILAVFREKRARTSTD